MAGEDGKHRDTHKVTDDAKDDAKAPPRDRDQSAISPQRAENIADKAEYSSIPGAQDTDDPGEGLLERDHMEDPPSAREQKERKKPVAIDQRGPAKKPG